MTTTILIPAKNEASGIRQIIRSVKPYADEIIVIDGHSTDDTYALAKKEGVIVIRDGGRGRGDGVKTGLAAASGDIVVLFDADGSHEPSDIPALIKPIVGKKADLVIASRRTGGSFDRNMDIDSLVRSFGADFLTMLVNLRFHSKFTDILYSFRAIRRSSIRKLHLHCDNFAIEQELIVCALRTNLTVTEIPSRERARAWGETKLATIAGVGLLATLILQLWGPRKVV